MSDQSHKLVITDGKHSSLCGWKNWNQATKDDEAVTCKRCLKKIGKEAHVENEKAFVA